MKVFWHLLPALLIGTAGAALVAQTRPPLASLTPDELFKTTKVWTAHLKFSAGAWKEIQPIQGEPTGRSRMTGGEWLDTSFDLQTALPTVIARGPDERAALLQRVPALAPYAELGDRVTVVWQGTVYRFEP